MTSDKNKIQEMAAMEDGQCVSVGGAVLEALPDRLAIAGPIMASMLCCFDQSEEPVFGDITSADVVADEKGNIAFFPQGTVYAWDSLTHSQKTEAKRVSIVTTRVQRVAREALAATDALILMSQQSKDPSPSAVSASLR